jgi:hypothetical protein
VVVNDYDHASLQAMAQIIAVATSAAAAATVATTWWSHTWDCCFLVVMEIVRFEHGLRD